MKLNQYLTIPLFRSLIILSVCSSSVLAQTVEIGTSPNPVGSGARAMGLGNAFIAVADDATAAVWNPGGLPHPNPGTV